LIAGHNQKGLLYKYLAAPFADAFVRRGEILFRSLSYFRAIEHAARGDEAEGVHIDAPDNDVTLETNTGIRVSGRYRYLRSVNQELTFAFCCSTELSDDLFVAFGADTCVEILDPEAFFLRCRVAVRTPLPIDPPGLIHRPVAYFRPNREAPLDVTNSKNLPFLKHFGFADQKEYRAAFARQGGFTQVQRIVQPHFTFAEEIAAAGRHERLLRLGDLRGITNIIARKR
jgi:hypothetical protein